MRFRCSTAPIHPGATHSGSAERTMRRLGLLALAMDQTAWFCCCFAPQLAAFHALHERSFEQCSLSPPATVSMEPCDPSQVSARPPSPLGAGGITFALSRGPRRGRTLDNAERFQGRRLRHIVRSALRHSQPRLHQPLCAHDQQWSLKCTQKEYPTASHR